LACDPDFRAIWRKHPDRNLQPPPDRVDDGDCAISRLGSAQDFKSSGLEWVERIEDLDVRALCTQGIVGGGVCIRTFIAPFLPAVCVRTTVVGCIPATRSFYQ
jgi:hypothetical protein